MARLAPPFAGVVTGTHALQAKLGPMWAKVGLCTVTAISDFAFAATGEFNVLGKSGRFDLAAELTDRDVDALRGPCTVQVNGESATGTYKRDGNAMVFENERGVIRCAPDTGGVVFEITGYPKVKLVV